MRQEYINNGVARFVQAQKLAELEGYSVGEFMLASLVGCAIDAYLLKYSLEDFVDFARIAYERAREKESSDD